MDKNLLKPWGKKFGVEFGSVLAASVVWALVNAWLEKSWSVSSLVKNGGGAMLVVGTVFGYATRSWKQVRDQSNHGDIVKRQTDMEKQVSDRLDASIKRIEASEQSMTAQFDKAAENLEKTVQRVVDYTTGGSSWMRLVAAGIEDNRVTRLLFFFDGDFPLYTIRLEVIDIVHMRSRREYLTDTNISESLRFVAEWPSLAPRFSYPVTVAIDLSKTAVNRLRLNWNARNGTWGQNLEIRWLDGQWVTGIRNEPRGREPIFYSTNGFPVDGNQQPIFTDLDKLAPVS